jgi:hypothetical protein
VSKRKRECEHFCCDSTCLDLIEPKLRAALKRERAKSARYWAALKLIAAGGPHHMGVSVFAQRALAPPKRKPTTAKRSTK